MIDVIREIEATQRKVGRGQIAAGEGHTVTLRRTYEAPIEDVWDALTNPRRIPRWFLPISGDLRVGGNYKFEGNAGGTIQSCERPNRLLVTWVGMETGSPADVSEVEVRLTAQGADRTTVEMVHTAVVPDEMWSEYGPGAVGVGWEGGVLGMALHLGGAESAIEDRENWPFTEEGREFMRLSSEAWGEANRTAGADDETVARNVANTFAFYTTAAPEG
jgi:uncharacterized protein YndB with AHSA1/START domain